MSLRIRDKQSARKATVGAQAAAVVLAVTGVAMGMWGPDLLELDKPVAPELGPEITQPTPSDSAAEVAQVDTETIAQNFDFIANRPKPDPVVADGGDDEPAATQLPTEDTGVRYVGSVRVGDRFAAWLNIGGATKMLRPGGSYSGVELVSVTEEEVVVSIDGGDEMTVPKAERQGPSVTVVVGGAPEPELAPIVAGEHAEQPQFTPDMSREERRAMLIDRAREQRDRGGWSREREQNGEDGSPDRNER